MELLFSILYFVRVHTLIVIREAFIPLKFYCDSYRFPFCQIKLQLITYNNLFFYRKVRKTSIIMAFVNN